MESEKFGMEVIVLSNAQKDSILIPSKTNVNALHLLAGMVNFAFLVVQEKSLLKKH